MMRPQLQSLNATHPSHDVSTKYKFVSTSDILSTLQDRGWFPVSAMEKRVNKIEHVGFQKHVIRLRKDDSAMRMGSESLVELILVNSHNRGSSVQLLAGVFRMVCSNGLVVSTVDCDTSFAIRHVGYAVEKVYRALDHIEENVGSIHATIQAWKSLEMTDHHKEIFAGQAALLRWEEGKVCDPNLLLKTRRHEDTGSDLWSIFNVVQENLVQGGRFRPATRYGFGRRITIRPVTGLDTNLTLNKKLWNLASSFAMTLQWNKEVLQTV